MATQFAPIELSTIKQGEFLSACERAFIEAQHVLIKHVEEHGISAAAAVNAKVEIKYDSANERYGILSGVQVKGPKKPLQVTTAFVSEDPSTGEPCLFAPSGGSTKENPRQSIMQDQEDKPIAS